MANLPMQMCWSVCPLFGNTCLHAAVEPSLYWSRASTSACQVAPEHLLSTLRWAGDSPGNAPAPAALFCAPCNWKYMCTAGCWHNRHFWSSDCTDCKVSTITMAWSPLSVHVALACPSEYGTAPVTQGRVWRPELPGARSTFRYTVLSTTQCQIHTCSPAHTVWCNRMLLPIASGSHKRCMYAGGFRSYGTAQPSAALVYLCTSTLLNIIMCMCTSLQYCCWLTALIVHVLYCFPLPLQHLCWSHTLPTLKPSSYPNNAPNTSSGWAQAKGKHLGWQLCSYICACACNVNCLWQ